MKLRLKPPPKVDWVDGNAKFPLGKVAATPGALESLSWDDIRAAISRHGRGDWGDCCPEDAAENEFAVAKPLRLFSVYHSVEGQKFWIITEADRSATTVLLPEEY